MAPSSGLDTSFRTALGRLDRARRLQKVTKPVSPEYEVAGLMKAYDGGNALLFESVDGYEWPVIGNLFGSPENCQVCFDTDVEGLRHLMSGAIHRPLPPKQVDSEIAAQQVVHDEQIDLASLLPVLTHSLSDAGRFITAGVVLARNPETGVNNASFHRLQLLGGNRTGIKLDYGRHLRSAFESAQAKGTDLELAVCLGTDIALTFAAAFMGSQMPESADEIAASGGIRNAPLEVAPCLTNSLFVPAQTEIVLEGRISCTNTCDEGPFAEFLGYLSGESEAPVFMVDAVTHRHEPIYHAINGFGRETIMLRKYVLEASVLQALKESIPSVVDVELTAGGLHRFHLVVQVAKRSPRDDGYERNAIMAAIACLKDLDQVVVVDDDIDIRDVNEVEYAIATRVEAARDIVLIPGARGHEYIRVSRSGIRTKVGIDATVPHSERALFRRAEFLPGELCEDAWTTEPGPLSSTGSEEDR
ncbi:MAG: 3-octaprenyl-4-hydroxybenzoate carboxy-lyase [Chloroflexi bacterium]|nr:3-octaprenyl-4-hydroxybenzoate carboxy-lyase [Chloroflexota bacterium]